MFDEYDGHLCVIETQGKRFFGTVRKLSDHCVKVMTGFVGQPPVIWSDEVDEIEVIT